MLPKLRFADLKGEVMEGVEDEDELTFRDNSDSEAGRAEEAWPFGWIHTPSRSL